MIHSAIVTGSSPHNARVMITALTRDASPVDFQMVFKIPGAAWCQPERPFLFVVIALAYPLIRCLAAVINLLAQPVIDFLLNPPDGATAK